MVQHVSTTNVETLLPEGEFIYSRTDLNSYIVEANDAFAKISGYTREAMIGQPHNMVRHPDMPKEAFADLWRDLKAGMPWRGLVKNRRSDGGFYWVVANASPVRENGVVVGYQSVRSCPSRQDVAAAEAAYARIRNGDRSIRVEHGRVVPAKLSPWTLFNAASIQTYGAAVVLLLLALVKVGNYFLELPFESEVSLVLGVLGLGWAGYLLLRSLPKLHGDLARLEKYLDTLLCTGDLRPRFELDRRDRLGDISRKMDRFVSSIQATVQGMGDTADQVAKVSTEVASGVNAINQSAQVQSDATSSAAAGIEQITVSIGEVAHHAANTREAAQAASEVSANGAHLSSKASATINALAETVKEAAGQVELLGEQSIEISRITGVIKEIAEQTNLLALNAAIEAARAGEQGRGFAVVADEVRKLAERTTQATQEISRMVGAIQEETQKAVLGMRGGASQVEDGVQLVESAQHALQEINSQMARTLEMVNDISHSTAEQQNAMVTMAQSVEQVAMMTDQSVVAANQTSGNVTTLDMAVERMNKAVHQFAV